MFSFVPLLATEIMIPMPIRITTPITIHVVLMAAGSPVPERGQDAADQAGRSLQVHTSPFHGEPPGSAELPLDRIPT
jgi:hypothetical protein